MLFTSKVSPVSWLAWQGQSERDYINEVISEVSNVTAYWACTHTHTLHIWLRAQKPSWLRLGHIMACTSPSPVQNNYSAIQRSVRENVKQKEFGGGGEWESMWEALFLVYGHWCCWRLGCSGGGTAQWLQLFWHEERPAGHSKPTTLSFFSKQSAPVTTGVSTIICTEPMQL